MIILIIGNSGCGKTYLSKNIAKIKKFPFYSTISYANIVANHKSADTSKSLSKMKSFLKINRFSIVRLKASPKS